MEIDDGGVEKETCVSEEETEICGAVGERGSAVCAQERENVFSLVGKRLCAVSGGKACGCVSS